jgi:thymidylate synthase
MHIEEQYLALLQDILDNGEDTGDRTGTGTISMFGPQIVHDMGNGFPLLTTKKVFWRGVVEELLWILRGETNIKSLVDKNIHIWDQWSEFLGDYPNTRRIISQVETKKVIGEEFYIGDYSTKGSCPNRNNIDDKLQNSWVKMMKRCYDAESHNYHHYGAKGIRVHKDWHNPKKFIEDVKDIINWDNKKNNWNKYELDKDYYQSNTYSKESCVWLHTAENNLYTKNFNPFKLKVNSKEYTCMSFLHAEEMTGIPKSNLHRWSQAGKSELCDLKYRDIAVFFDFNVSKDLRFLFTSGELGPVYGKQWRNWYVDENYPVMIEGKEYSHIDQIANVIERIKTNPSCRRLIVSAWNPADIPDMKLPPCHAFFQFKVYGNKLSLKLTQRSADMFLGVPFNIASYALLLHIVAKMTGLVPHQFIHSFGDCHIYKNHIDQVKSQLLRLPRQLPQLVIADNNYKDPSEFKFEDFTLVGYDPHPAIKGDVSV